MTSEVVRIDLHKETLPNGGQVFVPQPLRAVPESSQDLIKVDGMPALRAGDWFRCGHVPRVGVFTCPPPEGGGKGQLEKAGQDIVMIEGVLVATANGTNRSCSEGVEECSNCSTVVHTHRPLVTINGSPVLLGR